MNKSLLIISLFSQKLKSDENFAVILISVDIWSINLSIHEIDWFGLGSHNNILKMIGVSISKWKETFICITYFTLGILYRKIKMPAEVN